jgi:hypothetical protein
MKAPPVDLVLPVPIHSGGRRKKHRLKIVAVIVSVCLVLLFALRWPPHESSAARAPASLTENMLTIPTIDYFPAQFYSSATRGEPEPHIEAF